MKKILVVSACDGKKNFIFEELFRLWYRVFVLNSCILEEIDSFVSEWILFDTCDIDTSVKAVIKIQSKEHFDGILTFWEDDVILTSKINGALDLYWIPYSQAKNIRDKFEFRKKCSELNIKHPEFLPVGKNTTKKDLQSFSYPCVLKPAFGASSAFVTKCMSAEDVIKKYNLINTSLSVEVESALHNGTDFFIESFLYGAELDIDILVQDGIIKYISITDNFDSQSDYFIEVWQCSPSQFFPEEEKNIKKQSIEIIEKLGFINACLHFEAKYHNWILTPIEINMRMWGDEVWYFNKEVYGVNLIDEAVKIACWEHTPDYTKVNAQCRVYGEYFLPQNKWYIKSIRIDDRKLENLWVIKYQITKNVWDYVDVPPNDFCYLWWYIIKSDIKNDFWTFDDKNIRSCFHIQIEP